MSRGIALTDEDRSPWLLAIRDLVERCLTENRSAVIACSALKQKYRDLLVVDEAKVKIVYLKGSQALITQRLVRRASHFFDPHLLKSQFETLEEPADAMVVDIAETPEKIADTIRARSRFLNPAGGSSSTIRQLGHFLKLFRAQPPLSRLDVLTQLLGNCRAANHT